MIRTITANVVSRKIVDDLAVIDWDDDKYGEPTEENILKALNDDEIFSCEVMEARNYIDEYLSISNIELDTHIRTVKSYMRSLEDKLNELTIAAATPTPKLPDKPGFYLTQRHTVLRRHHDGEWEMFDNSGSLRRVYWEEQGLCSKLGPDAFPLVPLGEVILPVKGKED